MTTIKDDKGNEFSVVKTHPGVFENSIGHLQEGEAAVNRVILTSPAVHILTKVEYTDEGIFSHYMGLLHPKKGLPDPDIMIYNDMAKKTTMTVFGILADKSLVASYAVFAILPWKIKRKFLYNALSKYANGVDYILQNAYFKPSLYNKTSKEVRKLISLFIKNLGIEGDIGDRIGKIGATFLEHDDVYRMRIEDIASECDADALEKNPRKELQRLLDIYIKRENFNPVITKKIGDAVKLALIALYHPKIRKAFSKAVREVDFIKMGLDEADRYHCLTMGVYDYMGIPLEERMKRFDFLHKDTGLPPKIEINSI